MITSAIAGTPEWATLSVVRNSAQTNNLGGEEARVGSFGAPLRAFFRRKNDRLLPRRLLVWL